MIPEQFEEWIKVFGKHEIPGDQARDIFVALIQAESKEIIARIEYGLDRRHINKDGYLA